MGMGLVVMLAYSVLSLMFGKVKMLSIIHTGGIMPIYE